MKPPASSQPRRAAAAAFIGTMIEWYDFYIYATAAALVFGQLFFPSDDKLFSTMAAFGTFRRGLLCAAVGRHCLRAYRRPHRPQEIADDHLG